MDRKALQTAGILMVLGVSGCAVAPEDVQPAYVSYVPYQSWSCQQLGEEQARLGSALAAASTQQNKTRSNDTAGVILLGLPVSSMSGGDIAPEIARYKGETEAVQKAMVLNSCGKKAAG